MLFAERSKGKGMKIGTDMASLVWKDPCWGHASYGAGEGEFCGTARFVYASRKLPHPAAMFNGTPTRTHRASFRFRGPSLSSLQ